MHDWKEKLLGWLVAIQNVLQVETAEVAGPCAGVPEVTGLSPGVARPLGCEESVHASFCPWNLAEH